MVLNDETPSINGEPDTREILKKKKRKKLYLHKYKEILIELSNLHFTYLLFLVLHKFINFQEDIMYKHFIWMFIHTPDAYLATEGRNWAFCALKWRCLYLGWTCSFDCLFLFHT